jgi:hypothetical protein
MGNAIQMLLMKMLTTFYRRAVVVVRPIDDTIPEMNPRLPIVITLLKEEDLPAYFQLRPDQDRNMIKRRLANGDQCFAVRREGLIVHSTWAATEQVYVPYLRRYLILKPEEIFFYDSFTSPAHRNRNLAQARGVYVFQHYLGLGYRRAIAVVALENKAGLGVPKALGYHPIGLYVCLRLGPWQWDWEERWAEEPLPTLTKMRI